MVTQFTLAGREFERSLLRDALDDATAGRGSVVVVAGEAGMGKTRLLDWLADEASATDVRVGWGRCWEAGGAPPFWPWIEALRSLLTGDDATRLVSRMGWQADAGAPGAANAVVNPVSQDHGARFRLFDAVVGSLGALAEDAPVLILLDDLHAADEASLLLLQFLSQRVGDVPLLVVGACRDTDTEPAVGDALGDTLRRSQVISLPGLDDAAVDQLVRDVAGVGSDIVSQDVASASAGNPLFVIELTRMLSRGRHGVPDRARLLLLQRLQVLDASSLQVVAVAAVLGRRFRLRDVELVAQLDADAVLASVSAAAGAQLVQQTEGDEWSFAHDLLRETVVGQLGATERRLFHGRTAAVLALRSDAHPAEIAHHAYEGGSPDAAARCRAAGDHALSALAYEEAERWYVRARQLVPADMSESYDLSMAAGLATHRRGAWSERRQHYLAAAAWARAANEPVAFARAAVGAAGYSDVRFDPARIALLEEALVDLEDTSLRARVLGELSQNLFIAGRLGGPDREPEARRMCDEAVALARSGADLDDLAAVLFAQHRILLSDDGSLEARLAIARELVALCQRVDDPERLVVARCFLAHDLLGSGDPHGAEAEVTSATRLAGKLRQPLTTWVTAYGQAGLALLRGQVASAAQLADLALEHGQQTGFADVEVVDAVLRFALGRLEEAGAEPPAGGSDPLLDAITLADAGHVDEARSKLLSPINDLVAGTGSSARAGFARMATLAEALWLCRDGSAAEPVYESLLPFQDRWVPVAVQLSLSGSTHHHLGLMASLQGRTDTAVAHFRESRRRHESFGARLLVAHDDAAEGATLLAAGRENEGRRLIERALTQYHAIGAPGFARRLQRACGERGRQRARPTAAATFARDGADWIVGFGDDGRHVRDSVGMGYLARLLADPKRELHCVELVSGSRARSSDAGPVLDDTAKAAFRARLRDLDAALEEADRYHDPARRELLEGERDSLIAELRKAVGLGGRDRRASDDAERARLSVTRAIRRAIARITEAAPELGGHLQSSVRTGTYCSYEPDPSLEVRWNSSLPT